MVFDKEALRGEFEPFEGGGTNESILDVQICDNGLETIISDHPVYMFREKLQGLVDIFKRYLFKMHFWVSLTFIFMAASYRPDIFSIGYISIVFVFFWRGTDFFMKPQEKIVRCWTVLLAYNITIIVIKLSIDIFGCRVGDKLPMQLCWIAHFFDLPCSDKMLSSEFCFDLKSEPSYLYDVVVFAVIVVQKRILQSCYFFNFINETFMTSLLASRFLEISFSVESVKVQLNI